MDTASETTPSSMVPPYSPNADIVTDPLHVDHSQRLNRLELNGISDAHEERRITLFMIISVAGGVYKTLLCQSHSCLHFCHNRTPLRLEDVSRIPIALARNGSGRSASCHRSL